MASADLAANAPFAARVAEGTGLDFYTIEGWVASENGPLDNPLNLGPGKHYGTPAAAADAVIADLQTAKYAGVLQTVDQKHAGKKTWLGAFPGEDKIIAAQAHAIAFSPWKGNDGLPRKTYEGNIDAGAALTIYKGIEPGTKGSENPSVIVTGPGSNLLTGGGWVGSLGDILSNLGSGEFWYRILLGIGGIALVILGAYRAFK